MKLSRVLMTGTVAVLAGMALSSCEAVNTVERSTTPVVLTGAQLPDLVGAAPGTVVAFRHDRFTEGSPWVAVPVQVDQRKVVGFGSQPASNATAGVVGTVYGSGSTGVTALQYADPSTFVGADSDPNLDADDEVVFMAFDAGGKVPADARTEPAGVVPGSGVAVQVDDPRGSDERGWVYLFRSAGALVPSAGRDYVNYQFNLTSGAYTTTYKRADGPNPETSTVVTPTYEASFGDRWIENRWVVKAGAATGVDVLDGHKNQFAVNYCGRSNATFADAEGAFIANIDGPVRAIRSYVGANSGPLTQRTHLMYRDREDVITDLRVHAIPGVMDFLDYSAAAQGMTYRSSTAPGGVTIDGTNDSVPNGVPTWEAVDGPQGQILTHSTLSTSASVTEGQFYRDQSAPPEAQCWGDASFLGASGQSVISAIPNTDPRSQPFDTLSTVRVTQFGAPAADPSQIAARAADWAADVDTPLQATVTAYRP